MLSIKEDFMLEKILKSRGIKITRQRMLIIELMNDTRGDIPVDEIYEKLKEEGLGLTTIYRNVKLLKKEGILKERDYGNIKKYKINDFWNKNIFFSFKCVSCNQVEDIEKTHLIHQILREKKYIEKKMDYNIEDISIVLYGKCSKCK